MSFFLKNITRGLIGTALVLLTGCGSTERTTMENLSIPEKERFLHPEKRHYPETWFHFIGGNVSKEGITADLEAIAESGISGIQLFHGQFGGEWPGVSPQIECLSESWDELILWTAEECKRLGLKFTMQNCPGWSYAGGPWIEPENSMRHLVYSRTDVEGGKEINLKLAQPQPSKEEWRDYQDLFVLAFPMPEGDTGQRLIPNKIHGNQANIDWKGCLTQDTKLHLAPSSINNPYVIDIDFENEVTLRTVEFPPINSFSHAWCYSPDISVTIKAKTNNGTEEIASLEMPAGSWQDDKPITIACRETNAKSLRVEIANQHDMDLSYIHLYSAARQQNWESEAGWTLRRIVREPYPEQSSASWLSPSSVRDITSEMSPEGLLIWDAPEGNWVILRVGHVNTGMKNGPAPAEATGWECNKLDMAGARANFDGYIGRLMNENRRMNEGLLNGILIDSWECKTQTWTNGLDTLFREKWNYPLLTMLPALFGYVMDTPETTARFLRDWRVTLNDLLVDNFFGEMSDIAGSRNLNLSFETASGDVFPGDILEYYKYADIPMCEFWHPRQDSFVGSFEFKPVKPCVSAGHVYGKRRVAAEAFTSFDLSWNEHPGYLKGIADEHLAEGVTHLVFHTYTHNPRTDFLPPSTSFGSSIGTPFLRLQTWWRHMPAFTDYLARCNYLLESGNPVSDVLLYLGDEQNHKPPQSLDFPEGYHYDYCNPDILLNRLSVKNGQLVTPEGVSYKMLCLYDCQRMLPETLEKIASFVEKGAIVVGDPPTGIATLSGGKEAETRFKKAVDRLWGKHQAPIRQLGKGKVYRADIGTALRKEKISPDIVMESGKLHWIHRRAGNNDIYFLSAPVDEGYKGSITFRSPGIAEIWNPLTGKTAPVDSHPADKGNSLKINMHLSAGESCFVVIGKNMNSASASTHEATIRANDLDQSSSFTVEDWEISFPDGWGISQKTMTLDSLLAWKDMDTLSEEGRAFSGTARYRSSFETGNMPPGQKIQLDLGRVEMIAKVWLNGKETATLWTAPYTLDITDNVVAGKNELVIEVTSTWRNRLAYDASLPEKGRKTWTINGPKAGVPLEEYGLLGPVILRTTVSNNTVSISH